MRASSDKTIHRMPTETYSFGFMSITKCTSARYKPWSKSIMKQSCSFTHRMIIQVLFCEKQRAWMFTYLQKAFVPHKFISANYLTLVFKLQSSLKVDLNSSNSAPWISIVVEVGASMFGQQQRSIFFGCLRRSLPSLRKSISDDISVYWCSVLIYP